MTSETTISTTFSSRGFWWLPTNPDNRIPGELKHSPGADVKLNLDGTLRQEIPKDLYPQPLLVSNIWGMAQDGKCYTLTAACETNFKINAPGGVSSIFSSYQLFIGYEHIESLSTVFESALVAFTDLNEWMQRDPFIQKNNLTQEGDKSVSIKYEMPHNISVPITLHDATISIEPSLSVNFEYQLRLLQHGESIRIFPLVPQKAEWYLDIIFKFRVLLSILIGRPSYINRIQLCLAAKTTQANDSNVSKRYVDICVYQGSNRPESALRSPEIPFTYPTVESIWPDILNKWFKKDSGLDTFVSLFFGLSMNQNSPADFQFLTLIQAIEAYHRTLGSDLYMSDEDYEPIKKTLFNAIPLNVGSDHRDALKGRIKYGNEYSLRKRLDLIIQGIPLTIRNMVTNNDNTFIPHVVATRNYLTHRDETQKDDVLDIIGMISATVGLNLLVEFIILQEIGIPVDLITTSMTTHMHFRIRPRI